MADKKISDLTSLSAADAAITDIIPIVDITAGETKSITISNLKTSIFSSPTFTGNATFSGTEQSTSTSTGAVRITNGGLGVAGNLNVGTFSALYSTHALTVNATTNAVTMTGNLTAYGNIEAQNLLQTGGNISCGGDASIGTNLTVTGGDLTVNTSAANSPPNSPFSAPVFKVDSSTERVGVNIAAPSEALDVTGNIKGSGNLILTDSSEISFGEDLSIESGLLKWNNSTTFSAEERTLVAPDDSVAAFWGDDGFFAEKITCSNKLTCTGTGGLQVNTTAANSPPNSPFSAPVFKVDSSTEKVGINKSIPTVELDVIGDVTATGIIKSERINVNGGKLYVDDSTTNHSVKLGAYGQGTFFGKEGSVNGAQFSLAVGSAGKIVEDLKIETFKITGNGFLELHNSPKTLVASPGAGKVIIVHQVTFFVDYGSGGATASSRGTGAGGWDSSGVDGACYGVGFSPTTVYDNNNEFYSAAGLPRNVVHSESGNFFWTGEPDNDFRAKADRALLLRSTSAQNIASSSALPVGASHYIKIRYQILNVAGDFTGIAGLTTISS